MAHIQPSELILAGFQLMQDKGYEKVFHGHRLRVQWSKKSIRIRMLTCSCPLVQAAKYSPEDLQALLIGLKTEEYGTI